MTGCKRDFAEALELIKHGTARCPYCHPINNVKALTKELESTDGGVRPIIINYTNSFVPPNTISQRQW